MMNETTLVYIERGQDVLMLHRVSKKKDVNHGKWIGVGGKFEFGESPEECMRREVYEETGLRVDRYRYCGVVTFVSEGKDTDMEYMHLFRVTAFHDAFGHAYPPAPESAGRKEEIRLKACDEGELKWLSKDMLTKIPHWVGDRIFLSLIRDRDFAFFSMKLVYRDGELEKAVLNEHNCLVTDRLILRPWLEEDKESLLRYASDPSIGPAAGWPPHGSEEESLRVIRDVLTRPEIYAIVLRDTSEAVGSVGLQNFRLAAADGTKVSGFDERQSTDPTCCSVPSEPMPDGLFVEAELGYWLARPFQGMGLMREAVEAVLRHAGKDLGLRRVYADYYEGNDASRRVMEHTGFRYLCTQKKEVPLLNEVRTSIVNVCDL